MGRTSSFSPNETASTGDAMASVTLLILGAVGITVMLWWLNRHGLCRRCRKPFSFKAGQEKAAYAYHEYVCAGTKGEQR